MAKIIGKYEVIAGTKEKFLRISQSFNKRPPNRSRNSPTSAYDTKIMNYFSGIIFCVNALMSPNTSKNLTLHI